jgi:allantoinase
VRGGTVVAAEGTTRADLGVSGGRVVAIGAELGGSGAEEIDARNLHVFPGAIDAHVHFNEPGRTDWEGFATGTQALAAGGVTAYIEMPLNAHPPTLDAASFDLKLAAARASSLVDFAFWGGLVPGNLDRMGELAERGVAGFKAFMASSGIDDFPMADDLTLYEGMARAAGLGLPVAVHAENDQITGALARRARADGRTGVRDYLASRPVAAELEAIQRAILFAQETGCRLHVVHVSTGRGVTLVAEARGRGVDVSCETCPHYLVLTEDDVERLGAVAKCAPPLRPAGERDALWRHILDGTLPMVASDHSPAPPEMKAGSDFLAVWGGISGCQHLLLLLLHEGVHARGLPMERIPPLTAGYPARRFGLPGKGCIAVDADADLVLVDPGAQTAVEPWTLFYRYKHSPYVGRTLHGRITRTLLRGRTVFLDGEIVSKPIGRLIKPLAVRGAAEEHRDA